MLNRSQIIAAVDVVIEKVETPEWGGSVFVKSLTGAEKSAFEGEVVSTSGKDVKVKTKDIRAKLLVKTICDKAGVRLFKDADVPEIGKKNSAVLERLFDVSQRLSGLTGVEALVKNSKSAQEDGSITG